MEKGIIIGIKFISFTCALLLMNIISFVCITGQEKEQKKPEITKEQIKNKAKETQLKQEAEEDIKPPTGEQWYEEGDEALYKFDITPVTPKEGIRGAIFIYYGHFIEPPYLVENIYSGENTGLYINKLRFYPPPEHIENIYKKKKEKVNLLKYNKKKLTLKEKQDFITVKNITSKINRYYLNLLKQYDTKKKTDQKIILSKLNEYLSQIKEIEDYRISDDGIFSIKIPDTFSYDQGWCGFGDTFENINSYEEEFRKGLDNYKTLIQEELADKNMVFSTTAGGGIDKTNFTYIKDTLLSNEFTREQKIARIYRVYGDLVFAKLLYYNIDISKIK